MRAVDVIQKKRNGEELSTEEIEFFIRGYVSGEVPDYQAAAFLMACCFEPLSARETADLTEVMRTSGDTIDFSGEISGYTVDKHSTGGVGDKTTLVLGPLVAACGCVVAKMSGRGLGHTGGTLDKLESIEGFQTELLRDEFVSIVNEVGVAVCGQTGNIVPADKKLYALRDVTATVEDTALIAASIMSKKLAISNQGIILDVKTGKGAFMKTKEDAIHLAKRMVEIGSLMQKDVVGLVTEMSIPLGRAVGNALEVQEALDTLRGDGPQDLVDLCAELGGRLLQMAKISPDLEAGKAKILEALENGDGLVVFEKMVKAQGGSIDSLYNLPKAKGVMEVPANSNGWIKAMDALEIGNAAMRLGAGRETKDDPVDHAVGIVLHKKVGDKVEKGESLATLHYNKDQELASIVEQVQKAYFYASEEVPSPPVILAEVNSQGSTDFEQEA